MQKQAKVKRTNDIAYRRERVSRLMVRHTSTRDMAAQLGVSEPTIRRDAAAVRKLWAESTLANADLAITMEIATHTEILAEAWTAWERSKADVERRRTVTRPGVAGDGVELVAETMTETVGRLPDPRYLATIQHSVERISELHGVAKTVNLNHSGEVGIDALGEDLSSEDRRSLRAFLETVKAARAETVDA
jgi:hypothetical protein